MPRYELADEKSTKFWEYIVQEARLLTCYGTGEASGKVAIKDFDCPARARKEANKRKKAKLAQGYVIVSEKRKKARIEQRNEELESVLFEEREDAAGYAVYSDWLQTVGEPRGEIIALHNALAERPEDDDLHMLLARSMYRERLQMWPPVLLKQLELARKDVPEHHQCRALWANGFIHSAQIGIGWSSKVDAPELIRELLTHNSGRFLSEMRIGACWRDENNPYPAVLEALGELGSNLRSLRLAELPDTEIARAELVDLDALLPKLSGLRHLHLGAAALDVAGLSRPELRSLSLSSPRLSTATVHALAVGPWPELASLSIDLHHQELDWSLLAPVFRSAPKLRELRLLRSRNTEAVLRSIRNAEILSALTHLVIADGDLEDSAMPVDLAEQLEHLKELNLDRHHLSDERVAALAAQCKGDFSAIHQRPKGARAPLSLAQIEALTSPGNLKRGKALAKPSQWASLGREGDLLWGEFQGSDFYQVFSRPDEEPGAIDAACTCPSQFHPCKHILALLLLEVEQHAFAKAAPPAGLVRNAENERYSSAFE